MVNFENFTQSKNYAIEITLLLKFLRNRYAVLRSKMFYAAIPWESELFNGLPKARCCRLICPSIVSALHAEGVRAKHICQSRARAGEFPGKTVKRRRLAAKDSAPADAAP